MSRSMATMASSTILPMVGCLALAWRCDQRASGGTQKTFSALYSSGSSGLAPGVVAFAGDELGVVLLEGVGDVFEEDEAEDDVLVFRRVHVVAQLVGGEPELGFEAEVAEEFANHHSEGKWRDERQAHRNLLPTG